MAAITRNRAARQVALRLGKNVKTIRGDFLSLSELKARGWHDTAINRYVGLTIITGVAPGAIKMLAQHTHAGRKGPRLGAFFWTKRTARGCIRHCLTNYDELSELTRDASPDAYRILRERVNGLIDEHYPQFAEKEERTT